MTALIRLVIAWFAGIFLARWLAPPLPIFAPLGFFALAMTTLTRRNTHTRTAATLALAMILGGARLMLAQPHITPNHIAFYNDSGFFTIHGKIAAEPDVRDTTTNYRIATESITGDDGVSHPVHGLLLIKAARYPEFHFGDTVDIRAQPETPPIFDDFSYRDFLATRQIYSYARRPHITRVAPPPKFSLWATIFRLKAHAADTINRILPEPEASLLNGILLGIRGGIPSDLYEQFNATGTSHIIVISGSNISLVVALLLLAGQRLIGRKRATWLALVGVAVYTVMVGADAAVVRAAIMGGLYVFALQLGRPNATRNTLFAAGWLMTVQNPLALWDVGFQLSFMATLGLVALVPVLNSIGGRWIPPHTFLAEAVWVTLAAQIATAPLILYQFGRLSAVSLLANFLIVPVQPLVMLAGGAATAAGMLFLPLGKLLAWLVWLPLAWSMAVVQWSAKMNWAQLSLSAPLWLMILLYAAIGTSAFWLNRHFRRKFFAPAPTAIPRSVLFLLGGILALTLTAAAIFPNLPDGNLHVAFLDVGQGDAVLITAPHGQQLLVDGGPSEVTVLRRLAEEMPLWDHSLDMVVSTHPDSDHLTGLLAVAQRYSVDTVLVSDVRGNSALAQTWRSETANAQVITAQAGMYFQLDDDVSVQVLNPGDGSAQFPDSNNHSVTLMVQMGRVRFLLSGDLEAPGESALLASGQNVRATVLKSPHHGSNTGSSNAFLDAVQPQLVVISVGANNRFGHPAPEVLARYAAHGISVLRTDQLGTVELVTDGRSLWLAR